MLRKAGTVIFMGNVFVHACVGAVHVHGPVAGIGSMLAMVGLTVLLWAFD